MSIFHSSITDIASWNIGVASQLTSNPICIAVAFFYLQKHMFSGPIWEYRWYLFNQEIFWSGADYARGLNRSESKR